MLFPTFYLWFKKLRKHFFSILFCSFIYVVISFILWTIYFSGRNLLFIDDFAERVGYGLGRVVHNDIFTLITTPIMFLMYHKTDWPILFGVVGCGIYYVVWGVNIMEILVQSRLSLSFLGYIWKRISILDNCSKIWGYSIRQAIVSLLFPGTNLLFWVLGSSIEVFILSSPSRFDMYWIAPLFIFSSAIEGIAFLYVQNICKKIGDHT